MIIIGYPGIGKSTLAGKDHKYIDLESSNFRINGERSEDWYKVYCKVAEDLSRQGYIVFVSCHPVVREALRSSGEIVAVIFPTVKKEEWLARLRSRYEETNSYKDEMAYKRVRDHYDEDIVDLCGCDIPYKMWLKDMGYDLEAAIIHMINNDILGRF